MTRNLSVQTKVSSLALAVALAAGPSPALAQSFQGAGSFAHGTGSINTTTGGTPAENTTTITVNTAQSVIDWNASDDTVGNVGAINFQPAGTTATFQNNPDLVAGDFAVLNRIDIEDPTRIVALNGNIQSLVNGQTGGSIFFYSPSGFVVTGTAVINVGSLVLTSLPVTVTDGNFINNGVVEFGAEVEPFGNALNPNAAINIISDVTGTAQISSSGSGSYVALVAPTILHQGDIRTDGTAALVAAEAATITIDPFGLFDIQVTVGTDAGTGIHVDGGLIDRNNEAVSSDNIHRAYLVAVAKNDAVTMLINNGASVGFEIGTSATVEDNAVVISGGYNIENGNQGLRSGVSNVPLTITNATLSSHVDAQVTGGAAINSIDGALTFSGNLSIVGGENSPVDEGNVLIDARNGNALTIGGDLFARAFRQNADGSQTGLITRLGAETASTINIGGSVTLDSDSFGTTIGEFQEIGTNAIGGNAQVNVGANSTLNVAGSINVHADGYGGGSFGGTAGNGMGGQALVMANNGNATVIVGGSVSASASGIGGSYIECSECGTTGGNGIGNNASVHTGGGPGNVMQIGGDVTVTAEGRGGAGDAQAGGGFGGTANLGAFDNATLTVAGDTEINANGLGGDGEGSQGGLGRGGTARIGTNSGGSIDLTGPVSVTANGEGGSSSTLGGTGTGGVAQISAFLGTIHAFNNVSVSAHSSGGLAFGSGTGGDGLADIETAITPVMTEAALFAGGGTLTVDGLTLVSAGATGGAGGFNGGDGGNAVAAGVAGTILGGAIIHAGNSDGGPSVIQLGGVTVSAEAAGGAGGDGQGGVNGSDGGNGGSATGGKAVMTAAAGSGDLTAGAVIVSASAVGGDGGSGGGGDGGSGGNGGDGGNATGGFINVGSESGNADFAQASNDGVATYTSISAFANAFGGNGGNAGFGAPAGVAGDGGDAIGGDIALLVRGSTVNVGNVNMVANANGGNGGLDVTENPQGDGGTAVAGSTGVLVTNRLNLPAQRGTLNAGAITGNALATGGTGGINGGAFTWGGGAFFEVINSAATIDSVNLLVGADGIDPQATQTFASRFAVINGTVVITDSFNIQTPGRVSVYVNDSTPLTTGFAAGSFTISADTFVHDETRPPPALVGVISADSISLGTGGDLIVDAHLISTASLSLTAPGLVEIEDATSGGDIIGGAGTSFTAGTLTAAGSVSLTAPDAISLDLVNAGTDIIIQSFDGSIDSDGMSSEEGSIFLDGETSISTGPLTAAGNVIALSSGDIAIGDTSAGGFIDIFTSGGSILAGGSDLAAFTTIDLDAEGDIAFGNVTADAFDFSAGGDVDGGNIMAGTQVTGEAGGSVELVNISVGIEQEGGAAEDGFAVGIAAEGSITVGDVEADEAVGFATLADLTTGSLDAGTDVLTLVGGDTLIGSIVASDRVYHGDSQMFLDAGGPDDFDPALVFAQTPVRSGGSYTVTGAIETGQLQVGAASISTGAITAFNSASLDAAGSVATGAIDTGLLQITAGTDISTGDIFAFDGVDMDAGGSILTGNIDAGSIDLLAGGDITTNGYLNTELIFQFADGGIGTLLFPGASITLEAGGDISTGDISSIDGVFANAGGSISTGTIDAIDFVEAHAGTSLTTDDIDAGGYVLLTAGTNLSANAISASDIHAAAGGTATVGGAWNSGTDVQLTSNDIDIGANGSIGGGDIALISTNATQTVVGDGVAGGGYQLSDAEYDRLNANDINVIADSGLGAAPLMLIGNLSVDASGIEGSADYEFITGDSETESAGGSIRILGEAVFTGMDGDDAVGFTTGTFELDADSGLLSLENAPGTLGGTLFLNAARIHVASGEILDQLAEDAQYDGYLDDLNAPAEVERPDGVIRAESIEIEFGDAGEGQLNTLYVQNMGSEDTPAGFVVSDLNLGDDGEAGIPASSVDLIINGQVVTEGGTLTGVDVRDLLVEGRDLTPFTESSTINGCLLSGPCVVEPPEPPFPPGFNPAGPGIQDEVTLIDGDILPPPEFGNEDVIDDNDEDTEDDSPITPPNPLFDTSELGDAGGTVGPEVGTPMRSSPGLTETGDIDDPVSGSGNPALIATPPAPPSKQEQQQ